MSRVSCSGFTSSSSAGPVGERGQQHGGGLVLPHPGAVGTGSDGGERPPSPPVLWGHPLGWGMLSGNSTQLLPQQGGSTHGCRGGKGGVTEQSPQPCTAPQLSPALPHCPTEFQSTRVTVTNTRALHPPRTLQGTKWVRASSSITAGSSTADNICKAATATQSHQSQPCCLPSLGLGTQSHGIHTV